MSRGYPTPNNPVGDAEFSCIPVYVPSNPEFEGIFAAAIYGLYATMSKEYFWRDQGTMSPHDAAFLSARGLAASQAYDGLCGEVEMSCIDVANCIETDETVSDAIVQSIVDNGFSQNSETNISNAEPPPSLPDTEKTMELLPSGLIADCASQPQLAMGIARSIVRELHETSEDILEIMEFATNTLEAWAGISSVVPAVITQVITYALDWVDWILETFAELYQAAYTQTVEDELSCAIFCHIMDNCSLSLSDLETIYQNEATIGTPPDGLIETLEFIVSVATSADKIAVAAFHYQILRLLSWGKFGGVSAPYLKSIIAGNQGSDYTYDDLCTDCPTSDDPTTYWKMYLDFRLGRHGTSTVVWNGGGNDGAWNGDGYKYNPVNVSTTNVAFGLPDLGAAFVIKAVATQSVRRGSDGNGTNDLAVVVGYPNANYAGTANAGLGGAFVTGNTNDVRWGGIYGANVTPYRSFHFRNRVNENASLSTAMLRVYSVVIWGIPNVGDVKPVGSVWAGNTLPSAVADLFPD